MKRNLSVLAVMVVVLLFFRDQDWAACPQDPIDLGICDTLYVETFYCDQAYEGTGGYDSVRVPIWVTHDSNTFWYVDRWVQDSISAFVLYLKFWKVGCADSVIFPRYSNWNNNKMSRTDSRFPRSMFRDITCEGITYLNRFADMYDLGADPWGVSIDVISHDPGHVFLALIPNNSGASQRWQEGSRILLATMTFLVYMPPPCYATALCLDTTSNGPSGDHTIFVRYDPVLYYPRDLMPICDTIYAVEICGDGNGDLIVNVADVVSLIDYLFVGGPPPDPPCRGNVNADDLVNIADVVYLINYLFVQGPPPSPNCCAR